MGKGFNNYMCKKFFHPASRDNLKRVWIAEQKSEAERKRQEELRLQYEKEQDLYNNKAILAKGHNKEKLALNFMYDPPPGVRKEQEKDDAQEVRFEWQRKYTAPRESYCKDDETIRDQPFGIAVRNVRCIKCKKWGHINTDKECPLYGRAVEMDEEDGPSDPQKLAADLNEDGLQLKTFASLSKGIFGKNQDPSADNQKLLSDDSSDEYEILKSLSMKQKKKLLKKLKKMDKKKKKKDKNKHYSSPSSLESDSPKKERRGKKSKKTSRKNIKEVKPREIVNPELLLKEITKGLKVDFVGGDTPYSSSEIKVKIEKKEKYFRMEDVKSEKDEEINLKISSRDHKRNLNRKENDRSNQNHRNQNDQRSRSYDDTYRKKRSRSPRPKYHNPKRDSSKSHRREMIHRSRSPHDNKERELYHSKKQSNSDRTRSPSRHSKKMYLN